ncbi:polyprenyl synthetase family protein [Luteolibacter sp. AS25]|uniref:polyprenyl synthetase family protein n=1 Tax=Luteolibacter sp. AS25 TaxID=3135776 RepID=UPI00398B3010
MNDLEQFFAKTVIKVDDALDVALPIPGEAPAIIHEAMRYSVFAGGKRLRPILCLVAAEACGGKFKGAMPAACAVEMLHTYSLVHDDLPCMDDDDLRRGRATCHKVYGEGMAVLCGDALLTQAFAVLSFAKQTKRYSTSQMVKELAYAGGSLKLIGGQVLDLQGEGRDLTLEDLMTIHQAKTAALLRCSLRLGGMSSNANKKQLEALSDFGAALGLAFQIIDDILDVTQTTQTLGKTAGKDEAVKKATYPSVIGLEESKAEARRMTSKAMDSLKVFGKNGKRLREIAEWMLMREY